MANEEYNGARFDVAKGVDIYSGEGVLIKRVWLDYMQTQEYAMLQIQLHSALNEAVELRKEGDGPANKAVIKALLEVARDSNRSLSAKLPMVDWGSRIRDLERQLLDTP